MYFFSGGVVRGRLRVVLLFPVDVFICREYLRDEISIVLEWYYGLPAARLNPEVPHHGPYSFCDYLRYKARRGAQGDVLDLWAFSLLFSANVTVIDAVTRREFRMRHENVLSNSAPMRFENMTHDESVPVVSCILVYAPGGNWLWAGVCVIHL